MATPERETVLLPLGSEPDPSTPSKRRPRQVVMREPTEAQWYVVTRMPSQLERGHTTDAMLTFGDLLEALMVQQEDVAYAHRGLVNGDIELAEYLNLLLELMRHFGKDEVDAPAPRTGPRVAAKRAAGRVRR